MFSRTAPSSYLKTPGQTSSNGHDKALPGGTDHNWSPDLQTFQMSNNFRGSVSSSYPVRDVLLIVQDCPDCEELSCLYFYQEFHILSFILGIQYREYDLAHLKLILEFIRSGVGVDTAYPRIRIFKKRNKKKAKSNKAKHGKERTKSSRSLKSSA
ncbi:hypothetical protein Tco_1107458 [Tanacetum coccineum]